MQASHGVLCITVAMTLLQITNASCCKKKHPLRWIGGEFHWSCDLVKSIFQSSGRYIPKNMIATRGQIFDDAVILALPRFKSGVPATLAQVSLKCPTCLAVLHPYPSWNLQEEGNCKAFQSVVDIFVDGNDMLWALDTGVVTILEVPVRRCPPKVVAVDIKTSKIVKTIDLSGLVCAASRLQYLAVDYAEDGRCFIYVSDAATRSILVFDVHTGRGYRVVLPAAAVVGCHIRDVLYIALVQKSCGTFFLYFTYLCGSHMFAIKVADLRSGSCDGHVIDVGVKSGKIVVLGTDNGSAMFFRFEGRNEVFRWDTNQPFTQEHFLSVYSGSECFLATHAIADYKNKQMILLESNFPDFVHNRVGCGAIQTLVPMKTCS